MPIYEYLCGACKQEFEEFHRTMSARDSTACPACGSNETERKMSVFATHHEQSASVNTSPTCEQCPNRGGACSM